MKTELGKSVCSWTILSRGKNAHYDNDDATSLNDAIECFCRDGGKRDDIVCIIDDQTTSTVYRF